MTNSLGDIWGAKEDRPRPVLSPKGKFQQIMDKEVERLLTEQVLAVHRRVVNILDGILPGVAITLTPGMVANSLLMTAPIYEAICGCKWEFFLEDERSQEILHTAYRAVEKTSLTDHIEWIRTENNL
jgi:hypothetical protein